MSFKEEIKQIVQNARKGIVRDQWVDKRDKVILPVLTEAENALTEMGMSCKSVRRNGDTAELLVGPRSAEHLNEYNALSFSMRENKDEVLCEVKGPKLDNNNETFSLDALTQEKVENKVKEFIRQVVQR